MLSPDPGFGLYVHWPFCLSKCPYCDFNSHVRARVDTNRWQQGLLKELDHRVRNNLSVIMGLLSMERNRRPPRPSDEALASLEHRLRSFLLVHDALRRQNYRGVPARELTRNPANSTAVVFAMTSESTLVQSTC